MTKIPMIDNVCKEDVFKKIYFDLATPLRNFIFYKSGNLSLAEDLLQDSFTKLWENCAQVSLEKSKSYLFTIANRLFINKMHHEKVVLKFENIGHSEADHESPQFLLEQEDFKQQLMTAIAALPEDQREVFLLNRIDKKKYREIAEMLEVSVKTIEKRMHKALSALRKIHKKV